MSANIFINYRKDDSRWNTQALYNELLKYFPKESIFKDFNTIGLGDDYVLSINKALEQCDVLLVIIGKSWLEIKNQNGVSRLLDPEDLVRVEIITALKRNIKVIPVLFDNTQMFNEKELPEELQALTRRQSISVDDTRFDSDVVKLADAINKIFGIKQDTPKPKEKHAEIKITFKNRLRTAFIIAIISLLISGVASLLNQFQTEHSDSVNFQNGILIGIIACIFWFVVGMVVGPIKKKLLWAVIGSLIGFGIFMITDEHKNSKSIDIGIAFAMPVSGLIVSIIYWMIQKLNMPIVK